MIIDGDLISGLDFALRMLPPDSIGADTIFQGNQSPGGILPI